MRRRCSGGDEVTGRITPLRALMEWRRYVRIVYRAVRAVIPGAEVYVTGGAAEDRLTARSDVDVLVVLPHTPTFTEAVEVRVRVIEKAEDLGLPPHAPIELHVIGREELRRYATRTRVIPASEV